MREKERESVYIVSSFSFFAGVINLTSCRSDYFFYFFLPHMEPAAKFSFRRLLILCVQRKVVGYSRYVSISSS